MSSTSQTRRGPTVDDFDVRLRAPRAVVAAAHDYPDGHRIAPHTHPRAQLVHAIEGVMTVTTADGAWVVPPGMAVWVPAGAPHATVCHGRVRMRTLYCHESAAAPPWPPRCRVVAVSPLLRELVLRAVDLPRLYDEAGPDGRVAAVILDELRTLRPVPLELAMPRDRRLRRLADDLLAEPAQARSLAAWGRHVGASPRTLARLFRRETGMTFRQWRRRCRMLAALQRLGAGASVTAAALDVGYDSPSAFVAAFRRSFGSPPGRYAAGSAPAAAESGGE